MPTFEEFSIRRDNFGRFVEKPAVAEPDVSLSEAEIEDLYSPYERRRMAETSLDDLDRLVNDLDDPAHPDRMEISRDDEDEWWRDPVRPDRTGAPDPVVSSRGFDGLPRDFNQELQDYNTRYGLRSVAPDAEVDEGRTLPRPGWLARRRTARAERQREAEAATASWQRTCERHDTVSIEHAEHESDALAVLDRPTLTDLSEPTTQRLYAALVSASDLRSDRLPDSAGRREYAAAVAELDVAWVSANQHADKVRLSGFEPAERKRITQARALMSKALDEAATPAERQTCYAKAMGMLEGLVPVPRPAAKAVESRTALALSS